MRVLGLDLSLTSTGVAFPNGDVITVSSNADLAIHVRIDGLATELLTYADDHSAEWGVDLVVIEDLPPTRAKSIGDLGMLHGVIRDRLFHADVPFVVVTPAGLKKYATGKGNCSKNDMLVTAVKRLGYPGSSWDEADALWLRAAGLDAYDEAVVAMPKAQRDALGKVDWPILDALGPAA